MEATHRDGTARRTIACFDRYADAQALVDRLSDSGFPVHRVSIVGRDLAFEEQVTGRLNVGRAALAGAGSGLAFGLLFGLLFGLFFAPDGLSLLATVAYWALVAAAFGAVIGAVGYWMSGGRRDFTSVSGVRASHFEVLADEAVADEAQRLADLPVEAPRSIDLTAGDRTRSARG